MGLVPTVDPIARTGDGPDRDLVRDIVELGGAGVLVCEIGVDDAAVGAGLGEHSALPSPEWGGRKTR